MSGAHPRGCGRRGLWRALGRADAGGELVPIGLGQVLAHLLMLRLLQVVGGGVLQVGLHLGEVTAAVGAGRVGTRAPGTRAVPPTLSTSPGTGGGGWKGTGVLMAGEGGAPSCCCCCCRNWTTAACCRRSRCSSCCACSRMSCMRSPMRDAMVAAGSLRTQEHGPVRQRAPSPSRSWYVCGGSHGATGDAGPSEGKGHVHSHGAGWLLSWAMRLAAPHGDRSGRPAALQSGAGSRVSPDSPGSSLSRELWPRPGPQGTVGVAAPPSPGLHSSPPTAP